MFVSVKAIARFSAERPVSQLIADCQDVRVVVYGLEPGQSVPPHRSSSSVLMHVLEGEGQLGLGNESCAVGPGDLAVCAPNVDHSISAAFGVRLVVMVTIAPRP